MSSRIPSTKPAMTHHNQVSMTVLLDGPRTFIADHLRIDARPAQSAEEAPVLDLHAMVLDDFQPRGLGLATRLAVLHAQLHPKHPRADGDRLIRERGNLGALAEAV